MQFVIPSSDISPSMMGAETLATSQLTIPPSLRWYCDSPHLDAHTYAHPPEAKAQGAVLVHVIHVQRHHKRTPDNTLPRQEALYNPPQGWHCDEEINIYDYTSETSESGIRQTVYNPDWNPFKSLLWNGTCASGQLTPGGFADAIRHGQDFFQIYGRKGLNPLFDGVTQRNTLLRTSPEPRTMQVARGFLQGMGYKNTKKDFPAHFMPSKIDNIVPSAPCAYASKLRAEIMSESEWTSHLREKQSLFDSVNQVLGTTNESSWNSWIDHAFDFLASRQCHGHSLPSDQTSGQRMAQEVADQVYEEGNWEYNYIWNQSPRADDYVKYSFAAFVKELSLLLEAIRDGNAKSVLTLFVGHDGTMIRLFKTLAMPQLRWPGLGSEVAFEIYKNSSGRLLVRILANGKVLSTTAPALISHDGKSGWIPLSDAIDYFNSRIPTDLAEKCAL